MSCYVMSAVCCVFCSVDPFTKKDWYDVKAPSMFNTRNIGKTIVTRTIGTSLWCLIFLYQLSGNIFSLLRHYICIDYTFWCVSHCLGNNFLLHFDNLILLSLLRILNLVILCVWAYLVFATFALSPFVRILPIIGASQTTSRQFINCSTGCLWNDVSSSS